MTERISSQELESYLWGAAVQLRGLVDAGDYMRIPAMVTSQSGLMVTSNRSVATPVSFL